VELKGNRVVLRPVRDGDVDQLERMFAEPVVARWWPRYDRARIQVEFLHPDDEMAVSAVTVDGDLAGIIQSWEEDDPDYRHAGLDVAIEPRWHGTGVALDALRTLARHLIEAEGHHRLSIDPAADNHRAIACYEKVGFKRVGVLRRYERGPDGTFHDCLLMDMLVEDLRG
jgi:aminoglycoside 6'-N-acetyltransferase